MRQKQKKADEEKKSEKENRLEKPSTARHEEEEPAERKNWRESLVADLIAKTDKNGLSIEKARKVDKLVEELLLLAAIRKPLPPFVQFKKSIPRRDPNMSVDKRTILFLWQQVTEEHKAVLKAAFRKCMTEYNAKMKMFKTKLRELQLELQPDIEKPGAPSPPQVNHKSKLRNLTAFKMFKKDSMQNQKKDVPPMNSKDRQAKFKEQWENLGKEERLYYTLCSQREKEKVLHEMKVKTLEEKIKEVQSHLKLVASS